MDIYTQEHSYARGYLLKGSDISVGPPAHRETPSISGTHSWAQRLGYSLGTRSWTHKDQLGAFIPTQPRVPGLLVSCPWAHCVPFPISQHLPDPPPPGPQSPPGAPSMRSKSHILLHRPLLSQITNRECRNKGTYMGTRSEPPRLHNQSHSHRHRAHTATATIIVIHGVPHAQRHRDTLIHNVPQDTHARSQCYPCCPHPHSH